MAQTYSFDIVSDYNKSELINAFDQSAREISTRYDLRGTSAQIEWLNGDRTGIKLTADTEFQIDAILDIFRKRLSVRGLSQKIVDASHESTVSNLKVTKEVTFKKGLDSDKAKTITKLIANKLPKLKTQIQGDSVRVQGSSKDDLQAAMQIIRASDFDFPVEFNNFR